VDELLDLRREASEAIVGELGARWTGPIARAGKVRARAGAAEDLTAYELMLRAAEQMEAYTPESLAAAEAMLERAVEIQPDLGEAWAKLSLVRYNRVDPEMAPAEMEALWTQGHEAALEAYRVAPEHPMALAQAANVVRWDDPAEAERMTRRAAELAPNDADILAYLAFRAAHFPALGPAAVDWIERAIRLNPARPNWYDWNRGTVMMVAGRHADAAEAYALAPDHIEAVAGRLSALALAGDVAAAQAGMTDLLRDRPHFTSAWFAEASGLHPDVAEVFTRGFTLAGAPER
jgi:tetratricopeptide (TPR) repeat protein